MTWETELFLEQSFAYLFIFLPFFSAALLRHKASFRQIFSALFAKQLGVLGGQVQHVAFGGAFSNPKTWPTVKSKQLNVQDLRGHWPGPI